MKAVKTARGFSMVEHPNYPDGDMVRALQASSAIDMRYEDSFDKPGSSYLWVGPELHLNREDVAEMIVHMQRWLDTGSLTEGEES